MLIESAQDSLIKNNVFTMLVDDIYTVPTGNMGSKSDEQY